MFSDDGTLHYNTRRHCAPTKDAALWRWNSTSSDSGETRQNPQRSVTLPGGKTGDGEVPDWARGG